MPLADPNLVIYVINSKARMYIYLHLRKYGIAVPPFVHRRCILSKTPRLPLIHRDINRTPPQKYTPPPV